MSDNVSITLTAINNDDEEPAAFSVVDFEDNGKTIITTDKETVALDGTYKYLAQSGNHSLALFYAVVPVEDEHFDRCRFIEGETNGAFKTKVVIVTETLDEMDVEIKKAQSFFAANYYLFEQNTFTTAAQNRYRQFLDSLGSPKPAPAF